MQKKVYFMTGVIIYSHLSLAEPYRPGKEEEDQIIEGLSTVFGNQPLYLSITNIR